MTVPPLYRCDVCGLEVDPKHTSVLQLLEGWVKGGGKSLAHIENRLYRYRHEACFGAAERAQTESLF